jgi:hypothetical protein
LQSDQQIIGDILARSVHGLVSSDYYTGKTSVHKYKLEPLNVYISVFANDQADRLAALKTDKDINILYESRPAINRSWGHTSSRNTVVVYELASSYNSYATEGK